jgi:hypothetical protein
MLRFFENVSMAEARDENSRISNNEQGISNYEVSSIMLLFCEYQSPAGFVSMWQGNFE